MDHVLVTVNMEGISKAISASEGTEDPCSREVVLIRRDRNGLAELIMDDMYLGGLMCE